MIGTRLPEASGLATGTVESLSGYPVWHGNARALELTGWAEQGGSEADCIVIVDGNRTVIGAGASVLERPDIERAEGAAIARLDRLEGGGHHTAVDAALRACALSERCRQ